MTLNGVAAAAYQFDATGNMLAKQEGLGGANALTESYPLALATAPEHAPTSTGGAQTLFFGYDADGNTCAASTTGALGRACPTTNATVYTYDAENRLTSRSDATGGQHRRQQPNEVLAVRRRAVRIADPD